MGPFRGSGTRPAACRYQQLPRCWWLYLEFCIWLEYERFQGSIATELHRSSATSADVPAAAMAVSNDTSNLTNVSQVLSRGLKPVRSLPARLCGWQLLFNHRGGYANIETLAHIRERNIDTSHLPQPLPDSTLGVLLLVR
jgi:hypothetical protein